ncbi:MAG: 2,3-bisphosphoglycerate-independent phosphoglycerate mutase [Deltaproteobacteria bacterium]|nr:2,3-bisphosphoglycerate-independent phosphoglycerate mutase [Deltaproteobacteria bacterium]
MHSERKAGGLPRGQASESDIDTSLHVEDSPRLGQRGSFKPVCLIVMDGWGINPGREGNAVALASTPNLTSLAGRYPSGAIDTSGLSVGLPEGQMGNSEVGHLTIGAGRIVYQELTRITKAVAEGEFKRSGLIKSVVENLKARGASLHLMGLLSDGGVHSHIDHLYALIEAVQSMGLNKVCVHAFLDGRDTPPDSGAGYMGALVERMKRIGCGAVATVSGRYYAMDRDNRWDRVEKAYNAMVMGAGLKAKDPVTAVQEAYARGETDEFVAPTVITNGESPVATVSDGDGMIFFNFRSDRAREITRAFVNGGLSAFKREKSPYLAGFICMTEYERKLNLPVLFPPQSLENILGEVLSRANLRQFRVSETEKYAHVTFFFNGGREEPFPGEDRLLIPSVRDVPTYDKKPEMRAAEIAGAAVEKLREGGYSFMLMNFANGDMVGHTGVLDAAIKACEAVDAAVGMVADEALKRGWAVIITSDHGNAERMIDQGGGPQTAHTTDRVPFILVDDDGKGAALRGDGGLKDVAPTVLKIMSIEKPVEMTGEPLF